MKAQTQVRINLVQLLASAMLLASATAFGGDVSAVADGSRSVNDGFGRSSAMPSGNGKAVNAAGDVPGVQNVAGRASQIPGGNKIGAVSGNGTDVSQLGRASGTMAASRVGGNTHTAGLDQ